ncbi:unnamed protein product [Caenorhabditis auriculariae]|uniref:NAD-dependent protein deacylase n=1 Tax=Caenorhabditis auriculariae TaxID=2777116 RepID=A0A8S1H1Y6_9PELO|nr:unnamed protein product [Caenorhabditis auriculariae]
MSSRFVPMSKTVDKSKINHFVSELGCIDRLLVLTGAGVSTESGIPDYRSHKVGLYERTNHRPIQHSEFMKSESIRQRYWARNFLAWPNFSQAPCNVTHKAVARWERSSRFVWLITQNVDGLHSKAGSEMITELHGSGHFVRCMSCEYRIPRNDFQVQLASLNPQWLQQHTKPGELAPDGDGFVVAPCMECGGVMKTDVIFFGDNVPRKIVDFCYEKVEECDGILVLGSSLTVMSGYRFVYQASLQGRPIFIANIGPTRADHLATMKIECKLSQLVEKI